MIIIITGTHIGVGKTMATAALAARSGNIRKLARAHATISVEGVCVLLTRFDNVETAMLRPEVANERCLAPAARKQQWES